MTKKGAVAGRTAAGKRRTFSREFNRKVIREGEAGKTQAKWLANTESPKTQSPSGGDRSDSIRIALLLVAAMPILTRYEFAPEFLSVDG